ncbi:response regulator [Romeria aff. gracilis LEGE 07310]|uniref:histidine kinase n=1 Tax=Vasconcelosia minhoensis LEGE 07310 TaxID=915328 RepID=A0A8J7A5C9_9CYAN|nr:ATP-binding protein [Romeria gracilis]MBE9076285.1 response regulator [Romeria aff. gracilis LEGE 07310]
MSNSAKADILVIDDTPENLHLLSSMLTERGYKVRSVTKGLTGLRGAQAAPPDLVLLDINMPQMNGYEVCQQLKANAVTREIPVIFISALGDVPDKVQAFSVGGVDFITKPFQVEEVHARIENHLSLRRLQQQLQAQNLQLQREIDERKRAEEKFSKAFLASPSPIAITTLAENRFVDVNPCFLRMTGYDRDQVIDHTADQLQLWLAPHSYDQALQQLSQTGALHNHEFDCRTHSGEQRTVLLCLEQITLEGQPCALNMLNDITERKRLENEFISVVSHELRTPMHSLIGALDLLSTGQLGQLSDQGRQILSMATSNTERLIRLVNDILDLERLKSGKLTLKKVSCDVADLLTQAAAAMQPMANEVQVKLQVEPIAAQVYADCDRILQTLTNLLSNAIKFSPAHTTVRLTARVDRPNLLIQVQDQGRGIPASNLETIFERFQQVDASDARKKDGTGLGLAICRNIVQQHGGQIWAESQMGRGSTFTVSLPLEAAHE